MLSLQAQTKLSMLLGSATAIQCTAASPDDVVAPPCFCKLYYLIAPLVRFVSPFHRQICRELLYSISFDCLFFPQSFNSIRGVIVSCARRSLCYPLYRHWSLVTTVLEDTKKIFLIGRCLMYAKGYVKGVWGSFPFRKLAIFCPPRREGGS